MRTVVRLFVLSAIALPSLGSSVARAQLAVADASNVIQTTATALNTARQVENTIQQIEMMKTQLQRQLQQLKTLDPTSFAGIERSVQTINGTFAAIQGDVNIVKWDVQAINRDFEQLFPKDWKKFRASDYDNHYVTWNQEIASSTKAAAHAQASIAQLQDINGVTASALSASRGADGEVRQLQALNQQLGALASQLTILINNIATTGRVTTELAAVAVSEKQAQRDLSDQMRQGFTDPGPPPTVLKRLP